MTVILRPYQFELRSAVFAAWASGARNVVMRLDTGGGKTAILADIVNSHVGASCVIAHRHEIVSQLSLMLARYGIRHNVIAAKSTRDAIVALHLAATGRVYYDPLAPAAVASVDTLVRATGLEAWAAQVTLGVVDECFPAGTLVDNVPIENIRIGDVVTAFDDARETFSKRRVTKVFKSPMPNNMVRLTALGHHVISCTLAHPFWTKRGWVKAGDLNDGDEIYCDTHDMLGMRDQFSVQQTQLPRTVTEGDEGVLRENMQHRIPTSGVIGNGGKNKPQIRLRAHEKEQSDAPRGDQRENDCYAERAGSSADSARRERKRAAIGGGMPTSDVWGFGLCRTVPDMHGGTEGHGLSIFLQTGLRAPDSQDRHRSGRSLSHDAFKESPRREERRTFEWVGLDRIEVYQPRDSDETGGSDRQSFVYNIEVEGLHTYVANGIVVHNCHHVVLDNKWHKALSLFQNPHLRLLLPTATPRRADGKGLGTPELGGDGVADAMVEGPPMRWLIDEGYLCDYRIICADSHIEELLGEVGKSGDWSTAQLKAADEQSPIVGNVVSTYRQWAPGQTGIVFASSVETAEKMLTAYRLAGVRAELVTGETDPTVRRHVFASLERGTVEVVLCVDIVSEGTDIPALQVGTFARATASLAVYMQQMGRLLRPLPTAAYLAARDRAERLAAIAASAKPVALVIDHVGNFMRHGPPDRPRQWQLARHGRRSNGPSDAIPMRACLNPVCCQPYERFRCECPYCGTPAPPPASRKSPAEVEGDMVMLDPTVLAALRGEVDKAVMDIDDYRSGLAAAGLPQRYILHNAKSFADKQDIQRALREIMGQWGGYYHTAGRTDREIQRIFWQRFGVDVMTAQTLGPAEASELMTRVLDDSVKLI